MMVEFDAAVLCYLIQRNTPETRPDDFGNVHCAQICKLRKAPPVIRQRLTQYTDVEAGIVSQNQRAVYLGLKFGKHVWKFRRVGHLVRSNAVNADIVRTEAHIGRPDQTALLARDLSIFDPGEA